MAHSVTCGSLACPRWTARHAVSRRSMETVAVNCDEGSRQHDDRRRSARGGIGRRGHGRFRARGVVQSRRGVRQVNRATESAREMERGACVRQGVRYVGHTRGSAAPPLLRYHPLIPPARPATEYAPRHDGRSRTRLSRRPTKQSRSLLRRVL